MQASAVGAQHLKFQPFQKDAFTTLGQAAEFAHDQAPYGVEIFVAKLRTERFIEISNLGQGLDPIATVAITQDIVFIFIEIEFVLDLTYDLFSTSSIVTKPATPPYSSTTMAM